MKRLFLLTIMSFFLSLSIVPESAKANVWQSSVWSWSSIDCFTIVSGISPADLLDTNVACKVRIKEIVRQCVNKKRNADPANGQPFIPVDEEFQGQALGVDITLSRKGKGSAETTISTDDIAAEIPELLDPVLAGCPNGNWHVEFAVTKLDGVVEVLSGASEPNNGGVCTVNVSVDPDTACQQDVQTRFSDPENCLIDDGNGGEIDVCPLATCNQDACAYFHHPVAPDDLLVLGQPDNSVCQKTNLDISTPDSFDCDCDFEVKKNGNINFNCNKLEQEE